MSSVAKRSPFNGYCRNFTTLSAVALAPANKRTVLSAGFTVLYMHAAVYARSLFFAVTIHSNTSLCPKIILTKHTYVMSHRKLYLLSKMNAYDDENEM